MAGGKHGRSARTGRRRARIRAAAGTLIGASLLMAGCALLDNHSQLTVAMLMEDHDGGTDVTTNAVDITAEACGDALDCVEAYSTDEANYYRFASRDRAADHAATLDDGFVIHYIVMDFAGKDAASKERQRWAMEVLSGTWQDYHGTFPDR